MDPGASPFETSVWNKGMRALYSMVQCEEASTKVQAIIYLWTKDHPTNFIIWFWLRFLRTLVWNPFHDIYIYIVWCFSSFFWNYNPFHGDYNCQKLIRSSSFQIQTGCNQRRHGLYQRRSKRILLQYGIHDNLSSFYFPIYIFIFFWIKKYFIKSSME